MVVVVVVVVVEMVVVVDGDDVNSVVLVCEIVSRCDVWHEKRVVSYVRREEEVVVQVENQVSGFCLRRDFRDAICVQHILERTFVQTEYTAKIEASVKIPTSYSKLFKRNDSPASGMANGE